MKKPESPLKDIIPLIQKWQKRLQLEHWKITAELMDGDVPEGRPVAAECHPNVPYQSATIRIYPHFFKCHDDKEEMIAHELVHCLTEEYKDLFRRALQMKFIAVEEEANVNERLTSWITRLVL